MASATTLIRSANRFSWADSRVKPSVITINGFFGRPHQLWRLHYALWSLDRFRVLPYYYHPRALTLNEHADGLAEILEQHKSHSTCVSTHFVTHGYGALVLRRAMQKLDWSSQRSRVVMIAPPNRGCLFARKAADYGIARLIWGSKSGFELSNWLPEDYDERIGELDRSIKTLVLAGTRGWNPFLPRNEPHDGRLMVSETRLNTPHEFVQMPVSHGRLLYHSQTISETLRFLTMNNSDNITTSTNRSQSTYSTSPYHATRDNFIDPVMIDPSLSNSVFLQRSQERKIQLSNSANSCLPLSCHGNTNISRVVI